MRRALQLSLMGGPNVSPNPFVGSVIVAGDRIIGEGYHRRYGEPHAEVNAIESVKESDRELLGSATMYVTLEPCSHYGKTPPCADLIIRTGIPHVVVASEDPFLKRHESGIEKMRKAGVEVEVGLMQNEARLINRRFFTAHTLGRPFVLLKWAQSADGFLALPDGQPVTFSTPFTRLLMHRERSFYDAIMVGASTVINDNPSLTCRHWPSRLPEERPLKATFDSPRLQGDSILEKGSLIKKSREESLTSFLRRLYEDYKITSLMVEGGASTLESFMAENLVDEMRVETAPICLGNGVSAPDISNFITRRHLHLMPPETFDGNTISYYVKNY